MPMPCNQLISLDAAPHYQVVSRCVRRQFLRGVDVQTGRYFTHRRVRNRARNFAMAEIFATVLCAYAVMSNHQVSGLGFSGPAAWRVIRCPAMRMLLIRKNISAEI